MFNLKIRVLSMFLLKFNSSDLIGLNYVKFSSEKAKP